jgi:uncharacterized membrane protein
MNQRTWRELTVRALFASVALAPFLPGWGAGVPGLGAVAELADRWFRFQCERDPSRTLPGAAVCARCLGLYVGFGAGGTLGLPRLSVRAVEVWITCAVVLLLLDVSSEALLLRPPSAALRVATGILLAYPIGLVVKASLVTSRA